MLSAHALASAIRAGRLTPADVAARCAEAIRTREPQIHAFTALDLDGLLAAAAAPGPQGEPLAETPFAGLPIGVKDVLDTVDFPTARGSAIYAGHRPMTDAAVVRMARRAGGLIAGKTATTELAFLEPTVTRNPHRLDHTPGGSSSGSAAAVAAGLLPLAFGTQTAGSVIRPASFCGVTGFKPSFKLLPTLGNKTFSWSLDTIGLFGAEVADVAFFASALTGRDLSVDPDAAPPRLALVHTARADAADADAHAALEAAARAAEAAGARVHAIALPAEVEAADQAQFAVQGYEGALALAHEFDCARDQLSPRLADYLASAGRITPDTYDAARRITRRGRHAFADLMTEFDAVLTFSAPGEAPAGLGSTGSPAFNRLWTLLGCPCINVTGLTGVSGLPIGVQVVGRFARDRAALTAARFVEQALRVG